MENFTELNELVSKFADAKSEYKQAVIEHGQLIASILNKFGITHKFFVSSEYFDSLPKSVRDQSVDVGGILIEYLSDDCTDFAITPAHGDDWKLKYENGKLLHFGNGTTWRLCKGIAPTLARTIPQIIAYAQSQIDGAQRVRQALVDASKIEA